MPASPPCGSEAPSTDESTRRRSGLGAAAWWPPRMPRFCHLGSASDTHSRVGTALDPTQLPACAGVLGPRAARRLLQLSLPTGTTPDFPDPNVLCAAAASARWAMLLPQKQHQPGFHGSGVTPVRLHRRHAMPASCAAMDLPQVDPPGHLLSLPDVDGVLEDARNRRLAGYQPLRRLLSKPLEDQLATHASIRGPRRAPGPPPPATRESDRR